MLCLWKQSDMNEALQDERLRGRPIATAAWDNTVPGKTLDRVKGCVKDDAQMGRLTALKKEHEKVLCQLNVWLDEASP